MKFTYVSRPSPIHGIGGFATRYLRRGELINDRVPDGFRGFNHSDTPNMRLIPYRDGGGIIPLRDIQEGEEITVDYGFHPSTPR